MILIVEDEAFIAFELEQSLKDEGFTVVTTWSFEAAIPIVESGLLQLAIVDMMLPSIADGAAVARSLMDRGVPVLVHTALSRQRAEEALGDVVPTALFQKPASIGRIVQAVRTALGEPKAGCV